MLSQRRFFLIRLDAKRSLLEYLQVPASSMRWRTERGNRLKFKKMMHSSSVQPMFYLLQMTEDMFEGLRVGMLFSS
jgi:hypothetical protein